MLLERRQLDMHQMSSGPGYQVYQAIAISNGSKIITLTVGLMDDPHQVNAIVASGMADIVALGRAFLADPRWPCADNGKNCHNPVIICR